VLTSLVLFREVPRLGRAIYTATFTQTHLCPRMIVSFRVRATSGLCWVVPQTHLWPRMAASSRSSDIWSGVPEGLGVGPVCVVALGVAAAVMSLV
jgi:hypothetical protein